MTPHWWVPPADTRFVGYSELRSDMSNYTDILYKNAGQEIWIEGSQYWELPAIRIGRTVAFPDGFVRTLSVKEYLNIKFGRQVTVSRHGS